MGLDPEDATKVLPGLDGCKSPNPSSLKDGCMATGPSIGIDQYGLWCALKPNFSGRAKSTCCRPSIILDTRITVILYVPYLVMPFVQHQEEASQIAHAARWHFRLPAARVAGPSAIKQHSRYVAGRDLLYLLG